MRGTFALGARGVDLDGIIPACAGNTPKHGEPSVRRRDHPRVCGEHGHVLSVADRYSGSSPRVRGTPARHLPVCVWVGIIPACAGNTPCAASRGTRRRDHPRVCGEHCGRCAPGSAARGSSPRVRGTPEALQVVAHGGGIIPACAGNTFTSRMARSASGDHPRVCGEHLHRLLDSLFGKGSSPRVRGTLRAEDHGQREGGIIPACAGNTLKNPSSKYHSD